MAKEHIHGIIASLALLIFYFAIMGYFQGFQAAVDNFLNLWYVMIPLTIGFGIQVGLYSYAMSSLKTLSGAPMAASGGVSTGSMIACCAHHISDVLPLLGLSAAAAFLVRFQVPLILVGILSNAIGITMMLGMIRKHNSGHGKIFLKNLSDRNLTGIRNGLLLISPLLIAASFFLAAGNASESAGGIASLSSSLEKLSGTENGLTIEAEPIGLDPLKPVKFSLKFDTHSGSLDFNPAAVSVLEDDNGKSYKAASWEGLSESSHHRNGILTFPEMDRKPKEMRLMIRDLYGIPERAFTWRLN